MFGKEFSKVMESILSQLRTILSRYDVELYIMIGKQLKIPVSGIVIIPSGKPLVKYNGVLVLEKTTMDIGIPGESVVSLLECMLYKDFCDKYLRSISKYIVLKSKPEPLIKDKINVDVSRLYGYTTSGVIAVHNGLTTIAVPLYRAIIISPTSSCRVYISKDKLSITYINESKYDFVADLKENIFALSIAPLDGRPDIGRVVEDIVACLNKSIELFGLYMWAVDSALKVVYELVDIPEIYEVAKRISQIRIGEHGG